MIEQLLAANSTNFLGAWQDQQDVLYGMLTDPMAAEVSCGFLLQVVLAGALGLIASHFWLHQPQENGLHATVTDPCEDLIEKAKLSERLKLGTKTPYQFEATVTDDSFMHGCPAVQVSCCQPNGLLRAPVYVSPLLCTQWNHLVIMGS